MTAELRKNCIEVIYYAESIGAISHKSYDLTDEELEGLDDSELEEIFVGCTGYTPEMFFEC